MITFFFETLRLGLSSILLHKLRSMLTALGIICGVAAVIWMIAIGEGNKQVALANIEKLGAQNIIVRSQKPTEEVGPQSSASRQRVVAFGLLRRDIDRIRQTLGHIELIVPLKRVAGDATFNQYQAAAQVYGTTPDLLSVTSLRVDRGRFIEADDQRRQTNVIVLGSDVAERLFPLADPLGALVRVKGQVFTVVGILHPVGLAGGAGAALVGRNLNMDAYIPLTTAEARYGDVEIDRSPGQFKAEQTELMEAYIKATDQQYVLALAGQIKRVIDLDHANKGDVVMHVPLALLEQRRATLMLFNILMTAIAAISLLVGGIGIMNIMLASVTERTREIGIRRAVGATRFHIGAQFLTETTVLSGVAGGVGVAMGLIGAALLGLLHNMVEGLEEPIVPLWVVVVSFAVSVFIGIVFGLYPAVTASRQDPIVALRHD